MGILRNGSSGSASKKTDNLCCGYSARGKESSMNWDTILNEFKNVTTLEEFFGSSALLMGVAFISAGGEGEPKEQGESHLPLFPQTPISLSDFLPF